MPNIRINLTKEEDEIVSLFALVNYCRSKSEAIKKLLRFFDHNYREDMTNEIKLRGGKNGNTRPTTTE